MTKLPDELEVVTADDGSFNVRTRGETAPSSALAPPSMTVRPAIKYRPWMDSGDLAMLRSLPPDQARQMFNLLRQQARSDQRFRERYVLSDDMEAVEAAARPDRTPQLRRVAAQAGGEDDREFDCSPLIDALLDAASGRLGSTPAAVAAVHALAWSDDDPGVGALLRALARQRAESVSSFNVARAARAAGLSDSTAKRRLEEAVEAVCDELVRPYDELAVSLARVSFGGFEADVPLSS